jgi:hypothetical protein
MAEQTLQIYKCESWEDFTVKVRPGPMENKPGGRHIYRGQHEVEWQLASIQERVLANLKRRAPSQDVTLLRERILDGSLNLFRDLSIGLPNLNTTSLQYVDEWWALGRHHGLMTPLLDWTHSPFIAAFFAFEAYVKKQVPGIEYGVTNLIGAEFDFGDQPVSVWSLDIDVDLWETDEFRLVEVKQEIFYRQKAQQGLFTHLEDAEHLDLESYLSSRGLLHALVKYEIPGEDALLALGDLERMAITHSRLFPDLEGAAIEANLNSVYPNLGAISESHRDHLREENSNERGSVRITLRDGIDEHNG